MEKLIGDVLKMNVGDEQKVAICKMLISVEKIKESEFNERIETYNEGTHEDFNLRVCPVCLDFKNVGDICEDFDEANVLDNMVYCDKCLNVYHIRCGMTESKKHKGVYLCKHCTK
jgi:hypothetical protein